VASECLTAQEAQPCLDRVEVRVAFLDIRVAGREMLPDVGKAASARGPHCDRPKKRTAVTKQMEVSQRSSRMATPPLLPLMPRRPVFLVVDSTLRTAPASESLIKTIKAVPTSCRHEPQVSLGCSVATRWDVPVRSAAADSQTPSPDA
jgi:hypothetical protein